MADITKDLEAQVAQNFDTLADDVLTEDFINSLSRAGDPADFRVPDEGLGAAGTFAVTNLSSQLRTRMMAAGGETASAILLDAPETAPDTVVGNATQSVRDVAAAAVQKMVCGELRQWFEGHMEQIQTWYKESGLKETVKKLADTGKSLAAAAVTAVTNVVGSVLLAYALIGVAVAAVAVAIYFLVKSGLPNYCSTAEA